MGLNNENRKDLINLYWEKATQTYSEAEWAISAQKWNVAANRIYYSAFHAVTALFIMDGYTVGTHRGSKAALGQRYVLTGKLSSEDGKLYAQLETMRDKADYDIIYKATETEVMDFFVKVQSFLIKIKTLLNETEN